MIDELLMYQIAVVILAICCTVLFCCFMIGEYKYNKKILEIEKSRDYHIKELERRSETDTNKPIDKE